MTRAISLAQIHKKFIKIVLMNDTLEYNSLVADYFASTYIVKNNNLWLFGGIYEVIP